MSIRAPRDHRHNPRDAKLRTLFNRPFHAIELEHGENKGDLGQGDGGYYFAQVKLDSAVFHRSNSSTANGLCGGNVEIFSDASAEHADQMIRVLSNEGGLIS